jgi:hypothetical protein
MPKFLVTVLTTVWEERKVEVEAVDEDAAGHAAIERICDPDQSRSLSATPTPTRTHTTSSRSRR